jgi:hypothetical protein
MPGKGAAWSVCGGRKREAGESIRATAPGRGRQQVDSRQICRPDGRRSAEVPGELPTHNKKLAPITAPVPTHP